MCWCIGTPLPLLHVCFDARWWGTMHRSLQQRLLDRMRIRRVYITVYIHIIPQVSIYIYVYIVTWSDISWLAKEAVLGMSLKDSISWLAKMARQKHFPSPATRTTSKGNSEDVAGGPVGLHWPIVALISCATDWTSCPYMRSWLDWSKSCAHAMFPKPLSFEWWNVVETAARPSVSAHVSRCVHSPGASVLT